MQVKVGEDIESLLIVEDEILVAMMMEGLARELGVQTIHIRSDAASALELLKRESVDCAVLDIWLKDGDSFPVADALARLDIPFFFATGSDLEYPVDRHSHRTRLGKPFTEEDFTRTVLDTRMTSRRVGA